MKYALNEENLRMKEIWIVCTNKQLWFETETNVVQRRYHNNTKKKWIKFIYLLLKQINIPGNLKSLPLPAVDNIFNIW